MPSNSVPEVFIASLDPKVPDWITEHSTVLKGYNWSIYLRPAVDPSFNVAMGQVEKAGGVLVVDTVHEGVRSKHSGDSVLPPWFVENFLCNGKTLKQCFPLVIISDEAAVVNLLENQQTPVDSYEFLERVRYKELPSKIDSAWKHWQRSTKDQVIREKTNVDALKRERAELEGAPQWVREVVNDTKGRPYLDIGMVFALKEEFEQLLPHTKKWRHYDDKRMQWNFLFDVYEPELGLAPQRCVATVVHSEAQDDVAVATDNMISCYELGLIVSIGLSGSLSEKVLLGDVVIGDSTDAWAEEGKIETAEGTDSLRFSYSGKVHETSEKYLVHARDIEHANNKVYSSWQESRQTELQKAIGKKAVNSLIRRRLMNAKSKVVVGAIACGPFVLAARPFAEHLKKKRNRKYLAADMESAAVLKRAHKREIRALIIRGISDLCNQDKKEMDAIGDGGLRRFAVKNALTVLWILLGMELSNRPHNVT